MKAKASSLSHNARLVRQKLSESLITPADAARLGLRQQDAEEVAKLPNIPPGPHNPGLLIPYFDLDGEPLIVTDPETNTKVLMYRLRYLPPRVANGREQKYTQPVNAGCSVYVPVPLQEVNWSAVVTDSQKELWITEGELKSIAATKAGQPTLGLGGVWNFKGRQRPLADQFYEFVLKDRRVVCVFDSDYVTNNNVRYACDRLSRVLRDLGADVCTLIVPQLPEMRKVGLDDFLRHGARKPEDALLKLRGLVVPWVDGTMNDSGNANIFVDLHGADLFYAREEGAWRHWDGRVWVPNHSLEALGLTEEVSARLYTEASTLQDEKARKHAFQWARTSGNEGKRKALLKLAETQLVRNVDCLDTDPMLFNCQNGILDLNTFRLRPHDPSLMLGLISPVVYDPKARCTEFDEFLKKVIPAAGVRDFLKRVAGYALTGKTGEHCFFILHGTGRNGKSTFIEVLMHVWGRYARSANGDTFLSGRRVGTVRDDLHALRGTRLVKAVETARNARLDEETVKEHTGGDKIVTRPLYGKQTEWTPSHKIILISNEKPHIEGTDEAIWSRVRMVPFEVTIPTKERITDYFQHKLKPEASGILNWALQGLRQYNKRSLEAPKEVLVATQEYREDENIVQQFLTAKCVTDRMAQPSSDGPTKWVTPDVLQAAFKDFCKTQGIRFGGTKLKDRLLQMGYRQERAHESRYWLGIQLAHVIPRKYSSGID
jgi:P4 family phage/plasmid primase-like protien